AASALRQRAAPAFLRRRERRRGRGPAALRSNMSFGFPWLSASSFHAPGQKPAQIVTLEREEEDEDGKGSDDCAGHHDLIILHVLAAVRGDRDGQRVEILIGKNDQRPHEIVPA